MRLPALERLTFLFCAIILFTGLVYAKRPAGKDSVAAPGGIPSTDIILVSMRDSGATFELVGKPVNITHRVGYDNQPSFWVDGKRIFYTSIREDNQADIYSYDIEKKTTEQFTKTPQSEYQPTPCGGGGKISVVRVEMDSTQCIWWYPVRGGAPTQLYTDMKSAAYHTWADQRDILLVALEKNNNTTLRTFDLVTSSYNVLRAGVGRCIAKVPNNPGLSFTETAKDTTWLWVYDLESKMTFRQVALKPGTQDYAWGPHRSLIIGSGSELFTCRPPLDAVWHKFADLKDFGYTGITRIAVSPKGDKLAIVVQDNGTSTPDKPKRKNKK